MNHLRMTFAAICMVLSALAGNAAAQNLTAPQRATLCTACKGAAACNSARQAGDSISVLQWLNGVRSPATPAWHTAAPSSSIEEAPSYTSYDTLAQGKRDSWMLLLRSPRDFTRQRVRNWVVDVWGNATAGSNAEMILQAGTYSATNAQSALGGTLRTTGTVSALDLAFPSAVSQDDANWLLQPSNCQ